MNNNLPINLKCYWCRRKLTDHNGDKIYPNIFQNPEDKEHYYCSVSCAFKGKKQ